MINKLLTYILFATLPLVLGCKKQTITTHENLVISGNSSPSYEGISSTQIDIYVNKLHIDLLGIQATNTEINTYTTYLKNKKLSEFARDSVIDAIMNNSAYYTRLNTTLSGRMIEGINEFQLVSEINTYTFIAASLYSTGDTLNAQLIEYERDKLITLKQADSLYEVGDITVNQFYAAFIDNVIYDEINMGSLNFTIACFENLFFRAPTGLEATNGTDMVDGQSKPLLQSDGNSKQDFIDILTTSDEFYQGLVIENYTTLISRKPNPLETFTGTQLVKTANDLKALKKSILHTDEYAGF